jgi:SAM-dependent methyltransferase
VIVKESTTDRHPAAHQSELFAPQSERFVTTHLQDYPAAPEWVLESAILAAEPPRSILDVGCGPGYFLRSLIDRFGAESGAGVEPAKSAVTLLQSHWEPDERMAFTAALAHQLPYETDAFDLVVCWSVLHWVGRNEYLQALGELIRVTRRHLLIMDFVAAEAYRVAYGHDDRFFTYKVDFEAPILASGIMHLVDEARWWDAEAPGTVEFLGREDLEPFRGNPLSYHARKACLFRKDYGALPLMSEGDFSADG